VAIYLSVTRLMSRCPRRYNYSTTWGLKPSPEIDLSLSEFLGMNQRRWFSQSVSELTYSKVVERLEKRLARARLARTSSELAQWDYESELRDIQYAVARAYVEVLVAQERVKVEHRLLDCSR
jgi:outer membrane protein TolC